MAAPSGSNLNPVRLGGIIQVPSVPENGVVYATLESSLVRGRNHAAAVGGRDARRARVGPRAAEQRLTTAGTSCALVEGLSRGRLEPAQFGGSPVAVNLVWLVAHTTVKGKAPLRRSADCSSARRRPATRPTYRFTSATAVATLFIASVARMITLRPASLSSSVTSNSSRRESGMPSFG